MNNMQNTYDLAASRQLTQHNVLRNTYWLLALSMVPTVFGAALGVSLHLPLGGGLMAMLFLAVAFGFIWGIEKNKDSGWAWPCCWASPSSWA
jgi:modulator of FtsH protease